MRKGTLSMLENTSANRCQGLALGGGNLCSQNTFGWKEGWVVIKNKTYSFGGGGGFPTNNRSKGWLTTKAHLKIQKGHAEKRNQQKNSKRTANLNDVRLNEAGQGSASQEGRSSSIQ